MGHDRYKSGFAHAPDTPLHPGDTLTLLFEWRADVQPSQDWMVEARLVNDRNKTVAAMSAPLVSERYPSSQWMAGEIVRGEHDLPVPATLAPGRYQLQLTVTSHDGRQPGAWVDLGPVVVSQVDGLAQIGYAYIFGVQAAGPCFENARTSSGVRCVRRTPRLVEAVRLVGP